jgi:TetR/AcrR family transcriptional regulator
MGIPERKEREKESRREEILNAAQKVFFEKGLQLSTMDEIAEAAELSKGTLYLYYRSKEDLYLAVMVRGMGLLADMFQHTISRGGSPIEMVAAIGETYYEFFRTHRQFFRMFYFFNNPLFHTQVTEEMRSHCTEENQRIWKMVIDVIQGGIAQGLIRPELSPAETGIILWSSANSLMMRIDNELEHWKKTMNVDLDAVLKRQNALLLEAIMTPKAKQQFWHLTTVGNHTTTN